MNFLQFCAAKMRQMNECGLVLIGSNLTSKHHLL